MNEAYVLPFYAIIEDVQRVTREKHVKLAILRQALQLSLRHEIKRARSFSSIRRNTGRGIRYNTAHTVGEVTPIQRPIYAKDRTGRTTAVEKSENTISTLVSTPVRPMITSRPSIKASSSLEGLTDIFEAGNTPSTTLPTEDPVHTTAAENIAMSVATSTEPFAPALKSTIISKASDGAKPPRHGLLGLDLRRKISRNSPTITGKVQKIPHESSAPTSKGIPAANSDIELTPEWLLQYDESQNKRNMF